MILLSLASKQIWPHVLTVAHTKPRQVWLLHSADEFESRGPAQRLKRFLDGSGLVPRGATRLALLPDSDFDGIEQRFDEIQRQEGLPLLDCAVNVTGGNKLMSTSAFRWAVRHARACYLDRRNQLTWFEAPDGRVKTRTESIPGHLTDELDPVALLRCQLDASEVHRSGQALTLNPQGRDAADDDLFRRLAQGHDPRTWLSVSGEAPPRSNEGDALEFSSALVLLKLGVRQVQRGLHLKVKSAAGVATRNPHAEIDLIFTWAGRLWLVDCKDRIHTDSLVDGLRRELPHLNAKASDLLDRIQKELSIGQTKALKEDLLAVREAGGLLGNIVCVRKSDLPEEVAQFARHNHIELVRKSHLGEDLRRILFPHRQASAADLASLKAHYQS